MKTTTFRTIAIGGAVLLSSVALAGCTINLGSAAPENNSGMMGNGGMMSNNNSDEASSSTFSGADIMFAQMMIPHHQGAIDMARADSRLSFVFD